MTPPHKTSPAADTDAVRLYARGSAGQWPEAMLYGIVLLAFLAAAMFGCSSSTASYNDDAIRLCTARLGDPDTVETHDFYKVLRYKKAHVRVSFVAVGAGSKEAHWSLNSFQDDATLQPITEKEAEGRIEAAR